MERVNILIVDDDPNEVEGRPMYVRWMREIFDHAMNRQFSLTVYEADSEVSLSERMNSLAPGVSIDLMLLDQRFTGWQKDSTGKWQPEAATRGSQGERLLELYAHNERIARVVMLSWVENPADLLRIERERVSAGAVEFWAKPGLDFPSFRQQIESILKLPSRFDLGYFERAYSARARPVSIWDIEEDLQQCIVGSSLEILRVRAQVCEAALSNIPVLITGETGTGKGLVAEAIHRWSERGLVRGYTKPYALNCAEFVEESLLRMELFGARKGAYTSRDDDKRGRLQEAHESTLFLDEVGLASERLQGVLLRALEEHSATPVGGTEADRYEFNVRFVAATDQDIYSNTSFSRAFRHRLSGLLIHLPTLRTRGETDIRDLVNYFLRDAERQPRMTYAAWRAILNYEWPGNVRQLRYVVSLLKERCALTGQTIVHLHDVERLLPREANAATDKREGEELLEYLFADGINYTTVSDRFLAWYVHRQHTAIAGGVRQNTAYKRTADALGCSETTVKNKLRDFREWRASPEEATSH